MAFPPFAWERPKRRAPSLWGLRKKTFEKTSQNIWWFENNSLPLHPLLRSEPRSWASRKKLRKKFRKNLEDKRKTPYLCNRFPIKRRVSRRAIFEEIYINNTVVQEQNWKQFWVKKEPSIPIYIGNELLIRNPDRATTYLDIIWYSGVKDTFTMKSLILAQDER